MQETKVVIIGREGLTTNLLYDGLAAKVDVRQVFLEAPESKSTVIKRRLKKIGFSKTFGQVLFLVLVQPFISKKKERIGKIIEAAGLKKKALPTNKTTHISSVHNKGFAEMVNQYEPDIIVINGTRIIKSAFLDAVSCPVVNIHVGITPKYRGVHGGYWAIHFKDPDLFGVTVHYVDKGIDTGRIITQKVIHVENEDNYNTYPILQYCSGVQLLCENIDTILNKEGCKNRPLTEISRLHYHPTLWEYLFGSK